MIRQFLCVFSAALLLGPAAHATGYKVGDIGISEAHARPTVARQPSGAAYLTLENRGAAADRLVSVSSPVAESAAIHTMTMDGNVMRMREAGALPLAPAAKIEMKPGAGYHIMLLGLKKPLLAGDTFALTLNFENAGRIEVSVPVGSKDGKPAAHAH